LGSSVGIPVAVSVPVSGCRNLFSVATSLRLDDSGNLDKSAFGPALISVAEFGNSIRGKRFAITCGLSSQAGVSGNSHSRTGCSSFVFDQAGELSATELVLARVELATRDLDFAESTLRFAFAEFSANTGRPTVPCFSIDVGFERFTLLATAEFSMNGPRIGKRATNPLSSLVALGVFAASGSVLAVAFAALATTFACGVAT
jgi:hypothetical protein